MRRSYSKMTMRRILYTAIRNWSILLYGPMPERHRRRKTGHGQRVVYGMSSKSSPRFQSKLIWITHACTQAIRRNLFPADEAIEPIEPASAIALKNALPHPKTVWLGPEARVRQTAGSLSLLGITEFSLRDRQYGAWSGQRLKDLSCGQTEDFMAWLSDPNFAPPGGESICDLVKRVAGWLDGRLNDQGPVIAVASPNVVRAAVVHAINAPLSAFSQLDVGHLRKVVFSNQGARWRVSL
jgi:broad specificity phosphatase PhoE